MKRSRAWFVKFRGEVYARGPVRFEQPVTEAEFRRWVRGRGWLQPKGGSWKRLPPGTQIWTAK